MGILVSQLPPAELARLKAELAEVLIANFCYPRFYDYRTGSLRMRPVDRAKRQEAWQYLSTVDFNAWGRIDLMSPDFQRQVERLFIYFVQRNRSFFGDQGRKRMADVRMLISHSSSSVVEGLRGHLTGRPTSFGNPRQVTSWVTSNVTGHLEPTWEQIVATTMLLQQQLQETRGEIKAAATNDVRPNGAPSKHSVRGRSAVNGSSAVEPGAIPERPVSTSKPTPQGEVRASSPYERPPVTNPLASPMAPSAAASAPVDAPVRKIEQVVVTEEKPTPAAKSRDIAADTATVTSSDRSRERVQGSTTAPAVVSPRELIQTTQTPIKGVITKVPESTTVLVSEEDVVIFEQMRQQLVVWIRVEAVRAGVDIAGHEPSKLLELLQQLAGFDETRLQVTSTLLALCDQIIAAGHASFLEYKQAMMFYLMHTRSSR
ncbi:MAG TPA: hypothetical protein VF844_23465 [Ktedonobacteraceae bacterium]